MPATKSTFFIGFQFVFCSVNVCVGDCARQAWQARQCTQRKRYRPPSGSKINRKLQEEPVWRVQAGRNKSSGAQEHPPYKYTQRRGSPRHPPQPESRPPSGTGRPDIRRYAERPPDGCAVCAIRTRRSYRCSSLHRERHRHCFQHCLFRRFQWRYKHWEGPPPADAGAGVPAPAPAARPPSTGWPICFSATP